MFSFSQSFCLVSVRVTCVFTAPIGRWALNRVEYMVGMSGKASEPRRGHSSQQKKAAAGQGGGSNKVQPPPEALHVATILGDGVYPADLSEKMAQVMNMLPSCQEEDVCIALHDHDFDTARAISALLDRDLLSGTQVSYCISLTYSYNYSSVCAPHHTG